MKIVWIGHACFKIEDGGYSVIIDPYQKGSVPGLYPVNEKANLILCSHEHGDHNGRESVLAVNSQDGKFMVRKIACYHDAEMGAKRGTNTIHVLETEQWKIAHFGDLGCDLSESQMNELKNLDIAMIPVGGVYTIDAIQAAELVKKLKPTCIIPMHYRSKKWDFGFEELGELKEFTDLMENVREVDSSEVEFEEFHKEQVLVLMPQNAIKKRQM